jgi:Family of unknown function (DUF6941)
LKVKLEILTICDFAAKYGEKLCLTGVCDIFHSPKAPVQVSRFFIVSRIRYNISEEGEHITKFSIVDQDGQPIVPPIIDKKTIQLPKNLPISPGCIDTIILNMNGIVIPKFGEYSVQLVVDGSELASQPLYLLHA